MLTSTVFRLISFSNKPEIQAQAAQEIQVYEQGYIDYLQALEFNITKIVVSFQVIDALKMKLICILDDWTP